MCFWLYITAQTATGTCDPFCKCSAAAAAAGTNGHRAHVAPLWFTNISGPTERRFPFQKGNVTLLRKNCGKKKWALMPELTASETDYPAKRSCLAERPICKGCPSQSVLRATSPLSSVGTPSPFLLQGGRWTAVHLPPCNKNDVHMHVMLPHLFNEVFYWLF
jgi:hypothetical protein